MPCADADTRRVVAQRLDDPSEYSVTIVVLARSRERYQYFISGGWQALARGLGLKVGDRVQLEPLSRDPWRLRLALLPPSAAPSGAPS